MALVLLSLICGGFMNELNWSEIKKAVRAKWKKLTREEIDSTSNDESSLMGLVQSRYAMSREEAQAQVRSIMQDFPRQSLLSAEVPPTERRPENTEPHHANDLYDEDLPPEHRLS
jgi:hypothetical protein